MLSSSLRDLLHGLRVRKVMLDRAEKWEKGNSLAASIFPAGASDRFSRAETTVERRMYRALVMLLTLRSESSTPKKLS